MFGQHGSPIVGDAALGALTGWLTDVEMILDKDTDPGLVGACTFIDAEHIEMQNKACVGGDGGTRVATEEDTAVGKAGQRHYYGRLYESKWAGWTPAAAPT